jgi:hypothetical protein
VHIRGHYVSAETAGEVEAGPMTADRRGQQG